MKAVKIILALALLVCLFDMPYGYYQLVRFAGMVIFGYIAYEENEKGNRQWAIFWLASAILINPILKIALGRVVWNVVDVFWAVALVWSVFKAGKTQISYEN
jgi:hypothetical protein